MFRRIARHRSAHPPLRRTGPPRSASAVVALVAVGLALVLVAPAGTMAQSGPTEQPSPTTGAFTGPAESANARFVVDGYRTLLGRDPQDTGLDFHLARLASGGSTSRESFAWSMLFSVEGSRLEVDRAYGDLRGRAAEPAGRAYWTNHLQGHGVLDLRVLLLSSTEYHNRAGGTDQQWVESLYGDVLGRASDPSGHAYWLARAQAGMPRPYIAAAIYWSDESLRRRTTSYYQEILSRNPSTAEREAGVALIRQGGERALRARLLASDEAFEPFLQAALS